MHNSLDYDITSAGVEAVQCVMGAQRREFIPPILLALKDKQKPP